MGMSTPVAALLGILLIGGLTMIVIGSAPIHQLSTGQSTSLWTTVDNWFSRLSRRSRVHGLTGLGVGAVGYLVTGWAVLILIVPILAVVVPALLADPPRRDLDVMRALERWVRLVSGSASTGKSVIDAIRATRRQAPALLVEPLTRMVARLDSRWDTRAALQGLADDLDSADADQVIAAIMMASERGGDGGHQHPRCAGGIPPGADSGSPRNPGRACQTASGRPPGQHHHRRRVGWCSCSGTRVPGPLPYRRRPGAAVLLRRVVPRRARRSVATQQASTPRPDPVEAGGRS